MMFISCGKLFFDEILQSYLCFCWHVWHHFQQFDWCLNISVPRDQCPGYDFTKMSAVNSKLHQQNCKCRHGSWCSRFCNAGLKSIVSILVNSLQWRHNGRDSVSNHQPHDCFLNRLFRHGSRKTSKLCVTGLYAGNSPGTGEFPA